MVTEAESHLQQARLTVSRRRQRRTNVQSGDGNPPHRLRLSLQKSKHNSKTAKCKNASKIRMQ